MAATEKHIEEHMTNRPDQEQGKAPGPGSIMWDTFSDQTLVPFSIPILIMQTAHPDIGAAVARYSVFKEDPWGRLFRTASSLMRFMYGGREGHQGRQEAVDLRALHSNIKGEHADGTKYHAINPKSYRIVPDTFLDGVIKIREVLGKPLTPAEEEQVYQEYIDLCLLFGIRRSDIEPTYKEFLDYYDDLLMNTMNYNETVSFLMEEMIKTGPHIKYMPMPYSWWEGIYKRTMYPVMRVFTVGFLDPRFREKHGLRWSGKDQVKYERYTGLVRGYGKVMPRPLRYNPFALLIMAGGHGVKLVKYEKLVKFMEAREAKKDSA